MGAAALPGAKLFRPVLTLAKMLLVEARFAVDIGLSKFPLEEERWNIGCCGLPGARDMRDPDAERACWPVYGA